MVIKIQMDIYKNNLSFKIKGGFSEKWFSKERFQNWENNTFYIFDHYANLDCNYIDIGAWIGPTVMYAAQKFKKVIAIDPDRLAFYRLTENLSVNNFTNVILVNKCLSYEDGVTSFGGNGKWGNSESTMLVSDPEYSSWEGRWSKEEREKNIETVETIKIETILETYNLDNIGFVKMDIEGGEMIVIPAIADFLLSNRPVLYISLHFCFLQPCHIRDILDILFKIYNTCYLYDNEGNKTIVTKDNIIEHEITSVVFEQIL